MFLVGFQEFYFCRQFTAKTPSINSFKPAKKGKARKPCPFPSFIFLSQRYVFGFLYAVSVCKHRRGEVPFAGIGQKRHDDLACVFRALCKLCCRKDCRAGGDAHQNALAARQRAAGRKRVLVLHGENLIVNVGVQRIRHKARADALNFMRARLAAGEDRGEAYADRFGVEFYAGKKPWEVPVDIAMPCATQNELDVEDAVMLVANNVRYYVEAANMPATAEALKLLRLSPRILTAGSKASGSGGVVVSALEMVQNSVRYSWSRKEVDDRLRSIMNNIYDLSAAAAAEYDLGYDLIAGSDIAAFKKISEAMIAQGL